MRFRLEDEFIYDKTMSDFIWLVLRSKCHCFDNESINYLVKSISQLFKESQLKFLNNFSMFQIHYIVKDSKNNENKKLKNYYSFSLPIFKVTKANFMQALAIVSCPSIILVENVRGDSVFLENIIQAIAYEGKSHKRLANFILELFKNEDIICVSGGGVGEIHKMGEWIKERKNHYKDCIEFKIVALYDSDKSDMNDESPNLKIARKLSEHINDISFTRIHILSKRELENYIPARIVFTFKPEIETAYNSNKDFIKTGLSKDSIEDCFKRSKPEELIEREGNNGAEFIEIIEKIAKII